MTLDYCILNDSFNINDFSCGDKKGHIKLNNFLKEESLQNQKEYIGDTIICFNTENPNQILGFMTLLADRILMEKPRLRERFFANVIMSSKYKSYPAIKIGRMAVQEELQRTGIGTYLFQLAVAIAAQLNEKIGVDVRFLTVDAKDIARIFYLEGLKFKDLDEKNPNFLYYDILG